MVGIEPTQKGPGSLFYLKYPEPLSRNAAVMLFIRFASITGKMSASVLYYLWDGLLALHPLFALLHIVQVQALLTTIETWIFFRL